MSYGENLDFMEKEKEERTRKELKIVYGHCVLGTVFFISRTQALFSIFYR